MDEDAAKLRTQVYKLIEKTQVSVCVEIYAVGQEQYKFSGRTDESYLSPKILQACESIEGTFKVIHKTELHADRFVPGVGSINLVVSVHNADGNCFLLLRCDFDSVKDDMNEFEFKNSMARVLVRALHVDNSTDIEIEEIRAYIQARPLVDFLVEQMMVESQVEELQDADDLNHLETKKTKIESE